MLAEGGVWLTEDTATSYDSSFLDDGKPVSVAEFGGGYGKNDTWYPSHSILCYAPLPCATIVRMQRARKLHFCRRLLLALAMLISNEHWLRPERWMVYDSSGESGE